MSNLLKSLIDGYKPDRGFKDTALFKKPRLEMVLECRFPALPVLSVIFKYADGTSEKFRVVMIKFESEYAVTEKIWRQYPTIVPERNDMPMEIEFVSTHYGQTAIISVRFIKNGTETLFRLKKVSGENIRLKNKILILGPRCAREGDLTHRTEPDSAVFVPKLSAQAGNSNSPSS
jgi:hypothetical protein